MTEDEYLKTRRESYKVGLKLYEDQERLYVSERDVPYQLRADIDEYRIRLVLMDEDGKKLPFDQAINNLHDLVQQGKLHSDRLARVMIDRLGES